MVFSCTKPGPEDDALGNIVGVVRDGITNQPIKGVMVSLTPSGASQITEADGSFVFENLSIQEYTIIFTAAGYDSFSKNVSVKAGQDTSVQVVMFETLSRLSVSPGLLNFEDDQTSLSLTLDSFGSGVVRWTATPSESWIILNKRSGTIQGTDELTVSVSRTGLSAGKYYGYIDFLADGKTETVFVDMSVAGSGSTNPDPEKPDYSEAIVSTNTLSNLSANLTKCERIGNTVTLSFTLTNTHQYANMGITLNNVNAFTQKTIISDDLGNQYPTKQVKISLAGKDFGFGNNIEGTLLPGIAVKCEITTTYVDNNASYMNYYIWTSTALPGSVNYTDNITLRNIKIH